ncbi:unnamed protein product [Rotaria sordida]|uniref:NHL repeat containing protein n=1 Tax=Rotaria sordida TaxID=392033 RepID=A0A815ZS02_9BILA|nr:unnamed protein product [Rotaria sordida]CAF1585807.1 unnamed protein product [Rotaria sordida]
MLRQPLNNDDIDPNGRLNWFTGSIPCMFSVFICILLSACAVAVILSLIPVYLKNAGDNIVNDYSTETGDITQTFVSNLILINGQSTTITNFDQIAQQIEVAYGFPAGSVRITNIVITDISTNADSGRRRRDEFYREKRQLISALFNTHASNFPVTFVFADGRSIQLELFACKATGTFQSFGISSATTGTITTTRAPVCSLQWIAIGTTVAGVTNNSSTDTSRLNTPRDVFLDTVNTLVVADTTNNRIQRWTIGAIQGATVAGQADGGVGTDATQLSGPEGVVVDPNGNIYVADTVNNRVQLWPFGATQGTTITGLALNTPAGIAYDANLNRLFVADTGNNQVIQYTLSNPVVSAVVAGTNAAVPPNPLNAPTGIFYDASSNSLIIANRDANNIIQWFLATNTFLVLAGDPAGTAGTALNRLSAPRGVALDSNRNIIVADTGNHRIILFAFGPPTDGTKTGRIIAGTGAAGNDD